jgi:Ca-activated chloride channel homolog
MNHESDQLKHTLDETRVRVDEETKRKHIENALKHHPRANQSRLIQWVGRPAVRYTLLAAALVVILLGAGILFRIIPIFSGSYSSDMNESQMIAQLDQEEGKRAEIPRPKAKPPVSPSESSESNIVNDTYTRTSQQQKNEEFERGDMLEEKEISGLDAPSPASGSVNQPGRFKADQQNPDLGLLDIDADDWVSPNQVENRERYGEFQENPRQSPLVEPVSTFSIDVDTGSYSNARRYIQKMGSLPPANSVRVEEFVNYFDYSYPQPMDKPFSIYQEIAPSPFDPGRYLLHIGIQGKAIPFDRRPAANLVFLIDVSGSMNTPDKLGLLKSALYLLTDQMRPQDQISLVVYAGAAGLVLEPTQGSSHQEIKDAIKKLTAGGSTAGSEGIRLAYETAQRAFISDGINRVILASDGDFNVGITNHDELVSFIETKREQGVSLTVLGFGTGNYNDHTMEQLANKGNGNYFYIDNLNEAQKVLVNELGATLQTIAKDVKIQIEFNPQLVRSYRLLGYENRKLRREEFDDDTIDAGEIGAGHTVTALYEITLTDSPEHQSSLRYQQEHEAAIQDQAPTDTEFGSELAFFRLRYKPPHGSTSTLIEQPLLKSALQKQSISQDFYFAAAVAHFAQKLRNSEYAGSTTYDAILELAQSNIGSDPWGYRQEFVTLVRLAKSLDSSL